MGCSNASTFNSDTCLKREVGGVTVTSCYCKSDLCNDKEKLDDLVLELTKEGASRMASSRKRRMHCWKTFPGKKIQEIVCAADAKYCTVEQRVGTGVSSNENGTIY